jgi:hypothetical protein
MFGALFAASNQCLLGGLLGLDSTLLFPLNILNDHQQHFLLKTEILAKHQTASSVLCTFFAFLPQQSTTTPTTVHHNLFSKPILAR